MMKNRLGPLLVLTALAAAAGAEDKDVKDEPVAITGCVLAGTRPGTYVLTHVVTAGQAPSSASVELGAAGLRSTGPENVYWLDSVKELRGLVGHKVEVRGMITELESGELEVEKEPANPDGPDNEVEIESGGKQVEAQTNRPVDNKGTPPVGTETKTQQPRMVHKVKVEAVRDVAATCP